MTKAPVNDWRIQNPTGGYRITEGSKTRLEAPRYDWRLQDTIGGSSTLLEAP